MKYSIGADDEFLQVMVSGREDDEPPTEVCDVIFRESRRLGRTRILIQLDQKAALSPTSQLMLLNRLPQVGFTHEDRIALVHRTAALQRANQFINTAAANRGVMVRNFPGVEDAKAWLREP
jgi:hypothetical protein